MQWGDPGSVVGICRLYKTIYRTGHQAGNINSIAGLGFFFTWERERSTPCLSSRLPNILRSCKAQPALLIALVVIGCPVHYIQDAPIQP